MQPGPTMIPKQEALSSRLSDLNATKGVRGSAVVTRDGLPLIGALPHGTNPETFAAMVATTVGAAETAAAEMDPTSAKTVTVTFERITLVVVDAGPELVLATVLESDVAPDTLLDRLHGLAKEVQEIL